MAPPGGNGSKYFDRHTRHTAEYEAQPFLYDKGGYADDEDFGFDDNKLKTRRRWLVLAIFLTIVLAAGVIIGFVLVSEEEGFIPSNKFLPDSFSHAAVASDSSQCSTVGKNILLSGGNAVDSAIATLLCNGLCASQSMGIGGGFFMTIYNRSTGFSTIIDARETAPGLATPDMYKDNPSGSSKGPLSIAVPSEVKGYWLAHQKYGQLSWKDIFQPAIKMAAEGFPVPIGLDHAIADARDFITTEPSLREVFFNPKTGDLFKEGEIMKRPKLAKTLRVISEEGMMALYNGSLTDSLMQDLTHIGSIITRSDLLNYTVLEKKPLEITLENGLRVISPPLPSGGLVLSFIMNLLDGYKFTSQDLDTEESTSLTYHRIIETFKFAYAKRTNLGDDNFIDVNDLVKNLTSRGYADEIRKLISDTRTYGYEYYGPTYYSKNTTSTSHLSVLDQYGSAVSVTSTINARFGSRLRGTKTGIIFNDEMDDFSSPNITNEWGLYPSPANFIQPGKRPLSSMCPAVFVDPDGLVTNVLGAAGGSKITTATAWVAAHNIWFGENIEESIDLRRLHHQLLPPHIQYEEGFNQNIVNCLKDRFGHNVSQYSLGGSIAQGIDVNNGRIYANCDFRKGGTPDGF